MNKQKAPPVDNEWKESRYNHLEDKVHDGLDLMFDALCWAERIDEQRNTKMLIGLKERFPYLVGLFDKLIKDRNDDEIAEGIRTPEGIRK